jgi:hypothetical protein
MRSSLVAAWAHCQLKADNYAKQSYAGGSVKVRVLGDHEFPAAD